MKALLNFSVIFFIFFFTSSIFSLDLPHYDSNLIYNMSKNKPKDKDAMINSFQAHFIKEFYLKQVFKFEENSLLNDEEKSEYGISNFGESEQSLVMDILADYMAKQDSLGLKDHFMQSYNQGVLNNGVINGQPGN